MLKGKLGENKKQTPRCNQGLAVVLASVLSWLMDAVHRLLGHLSSGISSWWVLLGTSRIENHSTDLPSLSIEQLLGRPARQVAYAPHEAEALTELPSFLTCRNLLLGRSESGLLPVSGKRWKIWIISFSLSLLKPILPLFIFFYSFFPVLLI